MTLRGEWQCSQRRSEPQESVGQYQKAQHPCHQRGEKDMAHKNGRQTVVHPYN